MLRDAAPAVLLTEESSQTKFSSAKFASPGLKIVDLRQEWAQVVARGRAESCLRSSVHRYCLCDLHLGFYGDAEGSSHHPWRIGESRNGRGEALRSGARRTASCSSPRSVLISPSKRCFRHGWRGRQLFSSRKICRCKSPSSCSWVREHGITVLDLPTAYWHELVHELPELKEPVAQRLRLVIVGGEKASAKAFSAWRKVVGNRVRWINTYGPTEASVIATAYEPPASPDVSIPTTLPIGRPIANTRIYLLDRRAQSGAGGSARRIAHRRRRRSPRIFEPSGDHGAKIYLRPVQR